MTNMNAKRYLIRILTIFFIINMFYFISFKSHAEASLTANPNKITVNIGEKKGIDVSFSGGNLFSSIKYEQKLIRAPGVKDANYSINTTTTGLGGTKWRVVITGISEGSGILELDYRRK